MFSGNGAAQEMGDLYLPLTSAGGAVSTSIASAISFAWSYVCGCGGRVPDLVKMAVGSGRITSR